MVRRSVFYRIIGVFLISRAKKNPRKMPLLTKQSKKGVSMNLSKKPLAMAYVPWQTFENVMEGECALRHGTIFEDLVFPFVGAQAACQADRSQNHNHSGSCGCHNRQPYMQNNSCGRRGVY